MNDDVDPVKDVSVDPVNLSDLDKKLIDSDSGTALSGEKSSPLPGNPFTYLSHEFPFLHKEQTPNMLDPFFKPWSQAPSIVFIIVESLGRGYTGENAYLGSFTPFLDSLMSRSLYWENCLSTSGRTFSVLPSLMGSSPFGEKGFAAM